MSKWSMDDMSLGGVSFFPIFSPLFWLYVSCFLLPGLSTVVSLFVRLGHGGVAVNSSGEGLGGVCGGLNGNNIIGREKWQGGVSETLY